MTLVIIKFDSETPSRFWWSAYVDQRSHRPHMVTMVICYDGPQKYDGHLRSWRWSLILMTSVMKDGNHQVGHRRTRCFFHLSTHVSFFYLEPIVTFFLCMDYFSSFVTLKILTCSLEFSPVDIWIIIHPIIFVIIIFVKPDYSICIAWQFWYLFGLYQPHSSCCHYFCDHYPLRNMNEVCHGFMKVLIIDLSPLTR